MYLPRNTGKMKLQRYLNFRPSEVVILACRMKQSLCQKLFLPYDIWDLSNYWEYSRQQIVNLLKSLLSGNFWQ